MGSWSSVFNIVGFTVGVAVGVLHGYYMRFTMVFYMGVTWVLHGCYMGTQ